MRQRPADHPVEGVAILGSDGVQSSRSQTVFGCGAAVTGETDAGMYVIGPAGGVAQERVAVERRGRFLLVADTGELDDSPRPCVRHHGLRRAQPADVAQDVGYFGREPHRALAR